MSRQAVVLAGGLGTRMATLAPSIPKILIEVAGAPFLHHLLRRLAESRFDRVLLCTGHRGAAVREALARGPTFGLDVTVSDEGERRLGTAGALRAALDRLEPEILVTYGDSYLTFDYAAPLERLRARPEARGCMAVYPNRDRIEPSNVAIRGDLVVRYDKSRRPDPALPALDSIDYGATALRREVISSLNDEPLGLDVVQAELAERRELLALPVSERFFEIGSPGGLEDLRRHFAARPV